MRVHLRYRKIRFGADQCIVEGRCMNYDNLLTANEIPKHVKDKYYNEPIICQYHMRSIVGLLSSNLSDSVVESNVTISLAFFIFIFDNIFQMYLC